jgi:hypothetical protein
MSIAVLEANWNGSHTLPAAGLYPHQWSWDSGFIAFGLRHLSPRRGGQELDSLLAGQWADGRIPQIIFDPHRDAEYSPGAAFWKSTSIAGAPTDLQTAGLVQPPNHAWAVWAVHTADPAESRRRRFLERAYPKLVAWHAYLQGRRDRGGHGLVSIVHPWESGTDNSPLWDDALSRISDQPRDPFPRPDLLHAGSGERPGNREYAKYYWLAERYRDHGCDDADGDYPFLFEDPLFNTLYAVSELALGLIADELRLNGSAHRDRSAEISAALAGLWIQDLGIYGARDVVTGDLITKATINGTAPLLLPGLAHGRDLAATLRGPRFLGGGATLPPSYDATAADHDPELYWRGPAWFNMAWLSAIGLAQQGYPDDAAAIGSTLAQMARLNDFPEYVNPWTGSPHGTRRFSWTAALTLDAERRGNWTLFA